MARQASTDERGHVHGVNPGTQLGRYTVDTRIEQIPGGELWRARDTTLERDVTLLVMPAEVATTAAGLDAARRAAGVESAQLVRILDVGTEGTISFVAEEGLPGARSYTEVIGDEGLPAEEVRRITGEVATGLEAARARGLHHLALSPDLVLVTDDGRVKVRGLATMAALSGTETEGEQADREDATGVVALAYAGLTATWPLSGGSTLPQAQRDGDGPVPPSRVAVAVPGDLDTICRETLAEGTGPDSPGDYAAQIAPWSRIPLAGAVRTTPRTGEDATDLTAQGTPASAPSPEETATTPIATRASSTESTSSTPAPATPDDEVTREIPITRGRDHTADGSTDDSTDETTGRRAAAAAAAAAAGAVGTGGKVLGDRLGRAARSAGDRSKEALHDARARREAIKADQRTRSSLGSAPVMADLEPPAPLLPAEAGAPPSRRQSNLVLSIMGGLVAVACLIGGIGTSRIGSSTNLTGIFGGDETTAVATTEQTSGDTGEPSSSTGGKEPFGIINAAGYDPAPGDGVEHNAEVQRVYDGNPETAWTTEGYGSESFGNVKQGVGIVVDLGQPQRVSSVTLQLPTTAQATVYAGDQASNSGTEIGRTEGRSGEVVLQPSEAVDAQYVTVWFTSLAQGSDGRYRAAVGEITVR